MESQTLPVIGIDLGTTFSCVACLKNGSIQIIANDNGERTTPSIVSYQPHSTEVIVGTAATFQFVRNAENTFYSSKRIIGKFLGDPHINRHIAKVPFHITKLPNGGNSGAAVFEITNGHRFIQSPNKDWVSPEEVAAEILKSLRASAEAFLGCPVHHAVITVPAYFNNEQRMATKNAGKLAGLTVLRLLNEPTAAALAYGEHGNHLSRNKGFGNDSGSKTILVFDLGGGTFDVSLLTLQNHQYQVKGVYGDNNLGGEDFTNRIVNFMLKKFAKQVNIPVDDLVKNPRVVRMLRSKSEAAKKLLSFGNTAHVECEGLLGSHEFDAVISRAEFEDICLDLFEKLKYPLDTVFHIAKMPKSIVDEVILVGGSTRIPKVKEFLCEYFNNPAIKETVNPDEAVAFGAAILAANIAKTQPILNQDDLVRRQLNSLLQKNTPIHPNITLQEVTPMTISTVTIGDCVTTLIPANSKIPISSTHISVTTKSYQEEINFKILEGESPLAEKNNLLGSFELINLTPRPRGKTKVSVTLSIDLDGILKITAYELVDPESNYAHKPLDSLSHNEVVIKNVTNSLTKDERLKMIHATHIDKVADQLEFNRRQAKAILDTVIDDNLRLAKDFEGRLTSKQRSIIVKIQEIEDWYNCNPYAGKDEYSAKTEIVRSLGNQFRKTVNITDDEKIQELHTVKNKVRLFGDQFRRSNIPISFHETHTSEHAILNPNEQSYIDESDTSNAAQAKATKVRNRLSFIPKLKEKRFSYTALSIESIKSPRDEVEPGFNAQAISVQGSSTEQFADRSSVYSAGRDDVTLSSTKTSSSSRYRFSIASQATESSSDVYSTTSDHSKKRFMFL